ncbi:MAG: asparagine synthase [Desulfurococcales archaeon]|nr:asparagine synthase [Desulfurococcales archaeon]
MSSISIKYRMPCKVFAYLLRKALINVLLKTRCECIALSAGIDTAVIAALAKYLGFELKAYTSFYANGIPRDLPYVNRLEKLLGIKVNYIAINNEYIRRKINFIKKCVNVTDDVIELRNDLIFYSVLEKAVNDGCRCVYTGSGGDEVFIGYRFMIYKHSDELEKLVLKYAFHGRYPELVISNCLGIEVIAPYLTDEVLNTALKIPVTCLRGHLMRGKEVLRLILESLGLDFIANRVKTPAESGAGTDILSSL